MIQQAKRSATWCLTILLAVGAISQAEPAAPPPGDPYGIMRKPLPANVVVLTFDDASLSHATVVAPLLKKFGFGGTFYVSDAFGFGTRKDWYMTWEQIKSLKDAGFEIGNHTLGHGQLGATGLDGCLAGLMGIEKPCLAHHIAKPTTFCWPFYSVNNKFLPVLTENGYSFARGGHERPYLPTLDNPLDAPSFTIMANTPADSFSAAVKQATPGRVVIFTFHGVPDLEHPSVGVEPARFTELMQQLKDNQCTVIAMRDLAAYVDTAKAAQLLTRMMCYPWGGRGPSWGWVTRKDNRLYLCVDKLPGDRKLTLPGMTTKIAAACFLADPKQKPLAISKTDAGPQAITVPGFPTAAFGENPTVIVATLQGGPVATLLDFVFPGLPAATIAGNEIRVHVPRTVDLMKLAPTYRTGSPLVKGAPASGSINDFTKPQTYTITAPDGSSRAYVVTVTPTMGVVGLSNPSFETFDVLNEQDDTFGRNPSGTGWTFKQAKEGDEVGINLVTGGPIFAPPAPDGTSHSAFMRGAGNGISQVVMFDPGEYTLSFDAVKRNGYGTDATPVTVSIDGKPVLSLQASQINDKWNTYTAPAFAVAAGAHALAFTLGEGESMDLIDNVVIGRVTQKQTLK
ncbi:MAG: polysaccharide deacetylase family protein [Akkermansiaceae bacterium]|nr:polysaccharide deacetylase family protein [Akkermansiaceae bacterium]